MQIWVCNFQKLLELEVKELETEVFFYNSTFLYMFCNYSYFKGDDETGVLHQIQSQICENIALYAQKYEEEFSSYMRTLVTIIWKLLIKTGPQPKYDTVTIIFNSMLSEEYIVFLFLLNF